jgi:hypothetical protein
MTLSLPERLAMLMPSSVFYRRRIAQEARTGEPELAVLAELVPRGGIVVTGREQDASPGNRSRNTARIAAFSVAPVRLWWRAHLPAVYASFASSGSIPRDI